MDDRVRVACLLALSALAVALPAPVGAAHLASDLPAAIAIFSEFGARVVFVTMPYVDPSQRQTDGLPWSENTPARTPAYHELVRQVPHADPRHVRVVDLNRMLAPAGVYTASLDGIDVRSTDGIRISPAGGALFQPEILPQVVRFGLQDAAATKAETRAPR